MTTTPSRRPIRFGIVAPLVSDVATWQDTVRRIADAGYDTLLVPDVPSWQPAPAPMLALAAATANLRVGTWVYAAPLRPAWATAWEAHSLSLLTDGRFEMGIGTGRPGIEDELSARDLPNLTGTERLDRVRASIAALAELDGADRHTPVVMAVRGPNALALAAEVADTVTFAVGPGEPRAKVEQLVRGFRPSRDVELALHVPVVGEARAAFMGPPDLDPEALREADSLAYLPSDPAAARDEIERRREELGFSYVVVGAHAVDVLTPVVAALAAT